MSIAIAQEHVIPAPELRGAALQLGSCHDTEVCLDGPGGCIAGETLMYNPVTGEHTPIKELYEKRIAPIVQTLMGAIQADVPFRKGVADLYRVTLASGRQCIVTGNHRFLTPDGWRFLSACAPGSQFLISAPCPHPTTEVLGPLVSPQDALRLSQTPLSSQERYSEDCCPDDVLPLSGQDTALIAAPSPVDALSHNRVYLCEDAQDFLLLHSHQHQEFSLPSRSSYLQAWTDKACTQSHAQSETSLLIDALCRYDERFQKAMYPLSPTAQSLLDGDNTPLRALSLAGYRPVQERQSRDEVVNLTPGQLAQCYVSSDTTQECAETPLESYVCNPSCNTSNNIVSSTNYDCTIQLDTLSSIEYERTDEYFDLHVPIAEHYLAEGMWHHNTGKTYAILYYIHLLLLTYPGAKWLVCRKYNVDLAGSAMATYQNDVLDPNEGVYYYGGSKVKPAGYIYPNGSFLAVSGLDRPSKLKSFECDGVYINEATEIDVDDLEIARMRLRKGVIPWQQIVMDTNPDAPTHWLNQRMNEGHTTRLLSRHEDNPRYYDAKAGEWTEEGKKYIFGILEGLTGVRYARYRLGLWAAAEGIVYEQSWDRQRNIIRREAIPRDWPRYLWIDFGYTNPFVCLWAAQDPDGRLIVYRQIYKTKTLVEEHARQIAISSGWFHLLPKTHDKYKDKPAEWADPLPRDVICDHDAEGRATLEAHLGLYTTPAKKTISDGIQAVDIRLRAAGDGKPRLMFMEGSLVERDAELAKMKLPTCTEDETEVYIWDTKQGRKKGEEPVDANNHGWDASRYGVAYMDLVPNTISYFKDIWA
jgi:hypothetical protein